MGTVVMLLCAVSQKASELYGGALSRGQAVGLRHDG